MSIDFTESELREFSPHMADFYVRALLGGKAILAGAGILDNGRRLSHWMAQFGAETDGGTLVRESLNYTTVQRIKEVWPARARKAIKEGEDLSRLLRHPVELGDWAYGGRLGNRKGTSDGYDYRGGGFHQVTGRENVERYCKLCGIETRPNILDDPEATLQFACKEWEVAGCNALADKNDLLSISTVINTGSATSGVAPNGMENRETWFDEARAIWWDHEEPAHVLARATDPMVSPGAPAPQPDPPVPQPQVTLASVDGGITSLNKLADQGSRIAAMLQRCKRWLWGSAAATVGAAGAIDPDKGTGAIIKEVMAAHPLIVLAITSVVSIAGMWITLKLVEKYLLTAANAGRYTPRGGGQP